MNFRLITTVFALVTIACCGQAHSQITDIFDFSVDGDGGAFNGAIDSPSVGGTYTLTSASNTFLQNNGSVSFMFRDNPNAPSPDTITNTLNVLDATTDAVQTFVVNGVDFGAPTAGGTLTGFSAGGTVQEWQLAGVLAFGTQSAPTTGSFSNSIDTLVWTITDYPNNTFGNTIDNLSISVAAVPEPTSLALLGLGGIGLVSRRRRRS